MLFCCIFLPKQTILLIQDAKGKEEEKHDKTKGKKDKEEKPVAKKGMCFIFELIFQNIKKLRFYCTLIIVYKI